MSINGQGWAPKGATPEYFTSRGKTMAGTGLDPAVAPGVIHAALTILERWGTMTFAQVSARAIDYAENGFPLRPRTTLSIENNLAFVRAWPANTAMWLKPDGSTYKAGETLRIPDLANTLKRMVDAERAAADRGRAAGIVAARDRFYKGDIAGEMVAFLKEHGAPWDASDFAEFFAKVEQPTMTTYRGYEVYSQTFNSQGPMLLETLNMLEPFDIRGMKRNSADYIHTITEALKLAYADRDTYFADPDFVAVPADGLLSKAYASERRKLIDPAHASKAYIAGDPLAFDSKVKTWPYWVAKIADGTKYVEGGSAEAELLRGIARDTTHISVIDKDGNVFDSTPSGAWIPSAVVLGHTGIPMSVRGEAFRLDKTHAPTVPAAVTAPPHARADDRAAQRSAVHGPWQPRERQPDSDDPPGVPRCRGVPVRLVSEPARRFRVAPHPDTAPVRHAVPARRRIQQAQSRGGHPAGRLRRPEGPRPRRIQRAGEQHCRLRDRRDR